ncbi:esterase-like activity of phytase family protein [Vibrio fluvialis]
MSKGKYLPAALLLSVLVGSAQAAQTSSIGSVDKQQGASLPYQVLRSDLKDTSGHAIEIRNGGYGSDMCAHPSNPNQFYAITDRGPNADYPHGSLGKGKMFPVPDYTPRIGLFEVTSKGTVKQLKTILLKRPDGTPITGLPNTSALGGTGETPYDASGDPIVVNSQQPFEQSKNPLKLDDYGLAPEGLVALRDGTFWVSDEYGPHLVHFAQNGVEIGRINAFTQDSRDTWHLPQEFAHRRANRGMEGLAITPDETTLLGIMQSTMMNPNKSTKDGDVVRIVTVDLNDGNVHQYLYRQEKKQNSNSGISALSANEFVVIERDGAFLRDKPKAMKHLYRIDLRGATDLETLPSAGDVQQDEKLGLMLGGKTIEQVVVEQGWDALDAYGIKPVQKTLLVDVAKQLHYPHDKLEGLWVVSPTQIAVINDDDFATWSSDGKLEQKYLDADRRRVDGNTLHVIDNLDLRAKP